MQPEDYQQLKAGVYLANPATGATKALTTESDWSNLFGFAATGDATASTIAATVSWVYSALSERRKTLGQIAYAWELNGEPIEDERLPFLLKTMQYAARADRAIQLTGNSYLWKWRKNTSRKIHAMRWLDPRAVSPDEMSIQDGVGYTNYKYNQQSGAYSQHVSIPADDIIRTYVEGLAELDPDSSAANAYNLAAQIIWGMEQTTDSFYDTNGLPIMLVTVSAGASKKSRDDTQAGFKRIFSRRRSKDGSKVVAVSNDVTITPLSFAPKDLAQAELSDREIRAIYAVNEIPLDFLNTSGDRAKSEQATRTLVLTMAARFQMIADELNEDADIQKAGLYLRVLVSNHPSMKRDMGLVFDAVMKAVSSGMTLPAALYINGVKPEDFPDGMQIEQQAEIVPEPTPEPPADVDPTDELKAAEMSQLKRFVRKGTHKKRPFSAVYLSKAAVKAEITAQDEADIAQLNADLQELIEKAANGEIQEDDFKEQYLLLFLLALRSGAASGAAGSMTQAGNVALLRMEKEAAESVGKLASEIYAGRYSAGGVNPLSPDAEPFNAASADQTPETAVSKIVNRVKLWGASVLSAFSIGQVFSEANSEEKLMWVVGQTDHCSDCLRLNGQVHTADEWAASGWSPQSVDLECRGYYCQCRLVDVPSDTPTNGGF